MDDQKVGRILRMLRHRLGWRQEDVGFAADVSQDVVSRAELGRIDGLAIRTLRRIADALGAEVVITIRWRGAELDRLLDEGHSALGGAVISILRANGWEFQPEVSYSVYGERGSIDLLAWHAASRALLVIEIKTELASLEETLRKHDAKVRLSRRLAAERFGWRATSVARLLVLPSRSSPRRQVARHAGLLDPVYPQRGTAVRGWLARPAAPMAGLLFVPLTRGVRGIHGGISRKRIRRPATPAA